MANSDSAHLTALKTARDAIIAGLAAGRATISYTYEGQTHVVENPTVALKNIEEAILLYERKAARASRSPFRPVRLYPSSPRGT